MQRFRTTLIAGLALVLPILVPMQAQATDPATVTTAPAFDTNQAPNDSQSWALIQTSTGAYFHANTLAEGHSFWYWEPGMAEPELQSDFPTSFSPAFDYGSAVEIAGIYYFQLRTDSTSMAQFYSFDPSSPVGERVTQLTDFEFSEWNYPANSVALGTKIIYRHFEEATGYELYSFDTVTLERELFYDQFPGATYPPNPYGPVVLGDKVYASGGPSYLENELYEIDSDGQATQITTGAQTGVSWIGTYPSQDSVMFVADDATNGEEVWIYDQTAGTHELFYDMYPGTGDGDPYLYGEVAGKYFFGGTSESGKFDDVFVYNPASGGSFTRITDFDESWVFSGFAVADSFYFTETPFPFSIDRLYRVDPANPTALLIGTVASSYFYPLGQSVMVSVEDQSRRVNPYYLNPANNVLERIVDFDVPTEPEDISVVQETENYLVIGGEWNGILNEDAVYYFDLEDLGTDVAPTRILDDSTADLSDLDSIFELDGKIVIGQNFGFFSSSTLHIFDPASPQNAAVELADRESYSDLVVRSIQVFEDHVMLFGKIDNVAGLYRWDDPAEEPNLIEQVDFGDSAMVVGDYVFYFKYENASGYELNRYNLLTGEDELFLDANPGSGSTYPSNSKLIGSMLYTTYEGANGYEPHAFDLSKEPGDTTAFFELADLNPTGDSYPGAWTAVGDKVAFAAYSRTYVFDPATGEVNVVDGTGENLVTYPDVLADVNGFLVYIGYIPGTTTSAIVYSDISGTPSEDGYATQVAVAAENLVSTYEMHPGADRVYFYSNNHPWGNELATLTISPTQAVQVAPGIYDGPVITSVPATAVAGEIFEIKGQRLSQIQEINFGDTTLNLAELGAEVSETLIKFRIPELLPGQTTQLVFTGSFGELRYQQNVKVMAASGLQVFAKESKDGKTYKVYLFGVEDAGKVTLKSNGKNITWFDFSRTPERFRSVEVRDQSKHYVVRTVSAKAFESLEINTSGITLQSTNWTIVQQSDAVTSQVR